MILVDSGIWVDHFRSGDSVLEDRIAAKAVVTHPMVIGEIAMGSLAERQYTIKQLQKLPQLTSATHREALLLVERYELFSTGLGYVDAHLLAATLLTPEAQLWSRDKRLHDAATRLRVAFSPMH